MHKAITRWLEEPVTQNKWSLWTLELLSFGYKNALSCIFPVFIFLSLAVSRAVEIPGIPRYDFLLILCIGMQVVMYFTGMETKDELKVITLFHLMGLVMEIHKVSHGSWSYPEEAWTKIAGVPLYSGFMYASVGSYVCQAWRRLDLQMINWPKWRYSIPLGVAIYANFFTNAWFYDMRWVITAFIFILFFRTTVKFNTNGQIRSLPMILAFFLIGFFLWLAENIATFLGAWRYTYQHDGWKAVDLQKLSSWSLLVIVSILIVAHLKFIKEKPISGLRK